MSELKSYIVIRSRTFDPIEDEWTQWTECKHLEIKGETPIDALSLKMKVSPKDLTDLGNNIVSVPTALGVAFELEVQEVEE